MVAQGHRNRDKPGFKAFGRQLYLAATKTICFLCIFYFYISLQMASGIDFLIW